MDVRDVQLNTLDRHGDLARWDGDFVPEQIVRASATAVDGSVIRRILAGVIVEDVLRKVRNSELSPGPWQ